MEIRDSVWIRSSGSFIRLLWNRGIVFRAGDNDFQTEVCCVLPVCFARIDGTVSIGIFEIIWCSVAVARVKRLSVAIDGDVVIADIDGAGSFFRLVGLGGEMIKRG